ncbi:MAG: hypothetical protein HY721_09760, partial [Planctomycetes bacterium]|nr:hypothetical protein [Planctomycetota bacterium]
ADTLLWEVEPRRALQAAYGMLLPLIDAGVPASAAVAERFAEAAYLVRFRAIVLSFEAWKPEGPEPSAALARWVRDGGSLVVLGAAGDLGGAPFWWRGLGHPSPLHHLLAELGAGSLLDEGDRPAGKGWVLRRAASPRRFADPEAARDEYLPLVDLALRKAGAAGGLETPGAFLLRRGPFIAAHAARTALAVPGRLIDVFDPELPLLDGARLEPGSSGLYRDAGPLLGAAGPASAGPGSAARRPRVLHTTHRLVEDRFEAGASRIAIRGPAETPAAARIDRAGRRPLKVLARDGRGRDLEVRCREEGATLYATFPNDPDGAVLEVRWGE